MIIRTRFAPSPTGFLHVGGLRTALFAYLFARKNNGTFILRIEDTDQERFVEGGIENIITSLQWAGIVIDEGVTLSSDGEVTQKGEHGPYIQSQRLEIYKKHVDILIESGHAYYCFCTKERLEELREAQQANKQPTMYDGHCREAKSQEPRAKSSFVVRMKMPREGETTFHDLIRGSVRFENALIDDQVLMKSDGFPTYHLANVVDDRLMEITHVIRGEEWLPSTPKHIMLYKMFGWEPPEFAHLSLLVNEQKQKLSKRHGDVSVEDFKEKGYLPEALVNFIAFLGWNPGDTREIFSLQELEKEFSLEKVGSSAAVFHREKLDWYNKQYIMAMDPAELAKRVEPFYQNAGIDLSTVDRRLSTVVQLEQGRANTLADIVEQTGFVFADELTYDSELLVWKKSTKEDAQKILKDIEKILKDISEEEWMRESLEKIMRAWIESCGYGVGDVLWPLRVALSGQKNSPGPFEIAEVLGKEKSLKRVQKAIEILK